MEVVGTWITHTFKGKNKIKQKSSSQYRSQGKEEVALLCMWKRGGVQVLRPCVTDMEFLIDPPRERGETVYVFVHSSSRSSSYTHT
jgi:hypothetical protein